MTSAIFAEAAELWAEMKLDWEQWIEWETARATEATNGAMLNRTGRDAGIVSGSLFAGPESRAMKYASDELKDYWINHPRVRLEDYEAKWLELRRS